MSNKQKRVSYYEAEEKNMTQCSCKRYFVTELNKSGKPYKSCLICRKKRKPSKLEKENFLKNLQVKREAMSELSELTGNPPDTYKRLTCEAIQEEINKINSKHEELLEEIEKNFEVV